MKIAELFAAIGFKIDREEDLQRVDKTLARSNVSALGLLAGVTALNAAFYAMMHAASSAALAMVKFDASTALSTTELQRWQAEAAKFDVAGDEMVATIMALQDAQSNIRLGKGDVAPWQFFGIDPSKNPYDVLRDLKQRFTQMDPAIARNMAAQMGISANLFQFLQRSNLELEKLDRRLILTEKQQKNLAALNRSWKELTFTLAALRNRFADAFAEPVRKTIEMFTALLVKASAFVDWLNSNTPAAKATRAALFGLVVVLGLLGTALASALAMFAVLKGALAAVAIVPVIAAMAKFAIVLGLVAAALGALFLLWDDWMTAAKGGESLFDWSKELAALDALVKLLEHAVSLWNKMRDLQDAAIDMLPEWMKKGIDKADGVSWMIPGSGAMGADFMDWLAARPDKQHSVSQENNVEINVHGTNDPVATGRAAAKSAREEISAAAYQFPMVSY